MGILRKANREPKKLYLDEESYIEVETDITKATWNNVLEAYPQDFDEEKGISIKDGVALQTALFNTFVKGWSLDVEATVQSYLELPQDAAAAIDTKLMEYFSSLNVGEPDAKKRRR